MSAPDNDRVHNGPGMLGLSTAVLRKVMVNPLKRRKRANDRAEAVFNTCASQDPVSAVLEGEIIPRLMMAHVVDGAMGSNQEAGEINAKDAEDFAKLPMRLEAPDLLEQVDRFLAQGASVEDVYLDLLAPAARHLGEMWNKDECDFVDVTMGLWRLQEVMREISLRSPPVYAGGDKPRTALFCPIPGDVHSFGAQMIDEVFARAGWQSEVLLQPERRELLDYLARKPVDIVGLTVSRDCPNSALSSLIKALRSVAVNPQMAILVGGPMINDNPSIVAEIGADGTGADAKEALHMAERLVGAAPIRAHNLI